MIGASSELEAFSLSCFFGTGVEFFFFEETGDGQPSLELRLKDLSFVGASFLRFLDFLGDSLGGFVLDFDEEDFFVFFLRFLWWRIRRFSCFLTLENFTDNTRFWFHLFCYF